MIAICTVIDRLVLLKMEERKKRQKSHELTDLNGVLPLDSKEKGMDNGAYVNVEKDADSNGNWTGMTDIFLIEFIANMYYRKPSIFAANRD